MLLNSCFDVVKKGGLLLILLLQSTIFQAHATDTDENAAAANEANEANENVAEAGNDTVTAESEEVSSERTFSFPGWPERYEPVVRERIPMAPPGPYMSSALSDFSFDNVPFGRGMDRNRDEIDRERDERLRQRREEMDRVRDDMHDFKDRSVEMSMERFSPDVPWPSNNEKAPTRWMPEDGYRFVEKEPEVNQFPYRQMPYNPQPAYYYGHQRPPVMGWPATDYRTGVPGANVPAR
jgi:hypothetical protein